jgi:hypothetical protein
VARGGTARVRSVGADEVRLARLVRTAGCGSDVKGERDQTVDAACGSARCREDAVVGRGDVEEDGTRAGEEEEAEADRVAWVGAGRVGSLGAEEVPLALCECSYSITARCTECCSGDGGGERGHVADSDGIELESKCDAVPRGE